jgi:hypothetical protein
MSTSMIGKKDVDLAYLTNTWRVPPGTVPIRSMGLNCL